MPFDRSDLLDGGEADLFEAATLPQGDDRKPVAGILHQKVACGRSVAVRGSCAPPDLIAALKQRRGEQGCDLLFVEAAKNSRLPNTARSSSGMRLRAT
ncbi:MAG TPA: hypothetical protein VMU59_13660 [Caulobacteraceae bacterium]|nr:hypothetical protein [Caulobacteraceae bacterium]